MKTFAFIVNLTTIEQSRNFWPMLKIVPNFIIKSSFKKVSPFKSAHIPKIQSIQGMVIDGYIIACPLLRQEESYILDTIIAAGRIAERLNVRLIGLDRFASIISDKGYNVVARNLKIPVTNGNALNAWSVFEAVYRMAKIRKINLQNSTLVIIGATDPVGSLCARKLSDYVSKIIIVGKDRAQLEHLQEKIHLLNPIEVIIEEDGTKAVKEADITINASSSLQMVLIENLKPETIFYDISPSYRMLDKANPRQDITVIRGGLIRLPHPVKLGINTGLPKDVVYASLAETMLLTFKERFVNYSFGDNINLDKLEEIADLSVQHGFEVWVPQAPVI